MGRKVATGNVVEFPRGGERSRLFMAVGPYLQICRNRTISVRESAGIFEKGDRPWRIK